MIRKDGREVEGVGGKPRASGDDPGDTVTVTGDLV